MINETKITFSSNSAAYLEEHRDENTAIQLLADRIARPPSNWTPDLLWNAYAARRHSSRFNGSYPAVST